MVVLTTVTQPCYSAVTRNLQRSVLKACSNAWLVWFPGIVTGGTPCSKYRGGKHWVHATQISTSRRHLDVIHACLVFRMWTTLDIL